MRGLQVCFIRKSLQNVQTNQSAHTGVVSQSGLKPKPRVLVCARFPALGAKSMFCRAASTDLSYVLSTFDVIDCDSFN